MERLLKKDQLRTLLFGLKGRKEIPMKYEYLGKGAENWANLIKSSSYGIGLTETLLIKNNLERIFFSIPSINLVDLGPGDGMKTIPIITHLEAKKKLGSYCAIDISNSMIKLAKKNILKCTSLKKFISKLTDFEEGNFVSTAKMLKKKHASSNFLLLLGNTVGNQFDRHRMLLNIRESMSVEDFLLIGLELRKTNNFKSIIEHYKVSKITKMITSNLDEINIPKGSGKVKIAFNRKLKQVEAWFVFNKKIVVKLAEENLIFDRGDKLLLMISYKARTLEFKKILGETGFSVENLFVSKNKNYALVLCKPKPFDMVP